MQSELVRIPKERIAVLIGNAGRVKRKLEAKTGTKINIDSETGEVEIQGEDALKALKATGIAKAIGRGFSPERAFELLNENYYLDVIGLKEEIGKGENILIHKRGRVIGKHGKAREEIEEETGAAISVYGNTIAIIGNNENIEKARKAIEMLLHGAEHSSVYDYLKRTGKEKFEL